MFPFPAPACTTGTSSLEINQLKCQAAGRMVPGQCPFAAANIPVCGSSIQTGMSKLEIKHVPQATGLGVVQCPQRSTNPQTSPKPYDKNDSKTPASVVVLLPFWGFPDALTPSPRRCFVLPSSLPLGLGDYTHPGRCRCRCRRR